MNNERFMVLNNDHPSPSPSTAPNLSMPELPFPRKLPTLEVSAPLGPIRDLFAPPGFGEPATDKDAQRSDRERRAGRCSAAIFVTRHNLQGVFLNEGLRIAVVDDAWMRLGQSTDGCTLSAIHGNEVRFECYDGEAALRVIDEVGLMRD